MNSEDLANNIRKFKPPDASILVAFDVVALYANIPLDVTIRYLKKLLQITNIPAGTIKEITDLINVCLNPNYCLFNGYVYLFQRSIIVPISSPFLIYKIILFLVVEKPFHSFWFS